MDFNVNQTNQKTLHLENLQIQLLFQTKDSNRPQEGPLLRQQLHTHSYAELFACLEGPIHIMDRSGSLYTVRSGELAIVSSGMEHMMQTNQPARWLSMGLIHRELPLPDAANLFEKVDQLISNQRITVYQNQQELCRLMQCCHRLDPQSELSGFLSFLAEFIKLPHHQGMEERHRERGTEKLKDIDRLLKLDDIINMNYAKNFSNEEIADLLFISKRQLSRIVIKNYGEPLRKILLRRRLQGAAELLKTTDHGAEEIARIMGFTNKNTFYREFKRFYGQTPHVWRKRNK